MNRKLSLLLIAILLSAQTLSLVHMADHGFEKHKHNGHVCEIYFSCSKNSAFDIPPAISFHVNLAFVILTLVIFSSAIRTEYRRYSSEPRAPPLYS